MNRQLLKTLRQEKILSSLDKLGFASRSQLQKLHDLGGDRNACRVMADLSEYVNHFRDIENIYYLNKKGAERVGAEKVLTKSQNYTHTLMRNDLYINLNMPTQWRNERIIEIPGKLKIIADAHFTVNGIPYLAEIDNTQDMVNNRKKIENYKKLKEVWSDKYGKFPTIIWVTKSEVRKTKILKHSQGLNTRVYLHKDLL